MSGQRKHYPTLPRPNIVPGKRKGDPPTIINPAGYTDDLMNAISDAFKDVESIYQSVAADVDVAARWVDENVPGVDDIVSLVKKVPWGAILHAVQAAVSVVPVLGTAVSDVLAAAEVAYELLTENPIEFAIHAAYNFALATVPAAASLHFILDPTVDAIIRIAVGHEDPTTALLHAVVDEVPDAPKFGDLSPRSIAAGLMQCVCSHRKVIDVGMDLVAEASGAAGPIAERAVRAVEAAAQHGFDPAAAMGIALDAAPVPAGLREEWDSVRAQARALGNDLLPEDLAALGAFAQDGVQAACEKALGTLASSGAEAVARMTGQGRTYDHIVETLSAVDKVAKGDVDEVVALLPPDVRATVDEIESLAKSKDLPQKLVDALVAAESHRPLATSSDPLEVLQAALESLP